MKKVLKELVDLRSGFQGKTTKGESYKLIKLKDVQKSGTINKADLETFDTDKMASKHLLKKGDIIFKAKSVDNTAALIEDETSNLVASAHFILMTVKKEVKNHVLPEYLMMYLNSEYAQSYCKKHAQGTTLPIIRLGDLENLEVILPPLQEQHKLGELYKLMLKERMTMEQIMEEREKQVTGKLRQVITEVELCD